jgi:hypothetical protein
VGHFTYDAIASTTLVNGLMLLPVFFLTKIISFFHACARGQKCGTGVLLNCVNRR